ncbi:PIN-like domain-containing protein [Muricoccus vinaceus]|uniref:VapC45 PIN like domain-containing protein n=1 Tax=Muricoccus vinaceus TaxID=424704 RepID=A0ABV6J3Z0_9PROT
MAGETGGLTFVFDQNFGSRTVELLRLGRMQPVDRITTLTELGYAADAPDEEWMPQLGARGSHAVITRDGEILRASVRLDAWKASGLTLLLLDGRWGQLPLHDLTRGLIYWWPLMVEQATAAKPGTAWTVPHAVQAPSKGIRLVTPQVRPALSKDGKVVDISESAPRRRGSTKA